MRIGQNVLSSLEAVNQPRHYKPATFSQLHLTPAHPGVPEAACPQGCLSMHSTVTPEGLLGAGCEVNTATEVSLLPGD